MDRAFHGSRYDMERAAQSMVLYYLCKNENHTDTEQRDNEIWLWEISRHVTQIDS